ncbi:MAG: 30S ribosomal protein S12 methylthiotransferase RimO [Lachnospiraceae bacterium]|nr:30S ribosomal protein S12 methylthiotransferase RimO [Lachnospiraceae bacterium]
MADILFISLGCEKNLCDSEVMLGLLNEAGHKIVDDESLAEVIVINTCSFIHDAKVESINTILEMAEYKNVGHLKALVVTGCLSERYKDEILTEMPEVDAVVGASSYDAIVEAIDGALEGQKPVIDKGVDYMPAYTGKRMLSTPPYMAYLKIAEGCNKRCTYCAIPSIRGHYRSEPMENIIDMARKLVNDGVVEITLVAQETTVYGVDIYSKKMLPELLRKLCAIEGLEWIRVLYCYPEEITDELIEVMATEPKICHYIDVPIQHSEDDVLRRMGRRTNRAELVNIIGRLRERIPDITIRTTLITGFPGESEEEYESMYRFVNEMEFERLGVFSYSAEEGTLAFSMPDQIDENVKEQRRDELMELQQAISYERGESLVGKCFKVLVEGYLYDEDIYSGRTYMDTADIDGKVFFSSEEELISGSFVNVKITDFKEYDLFGEIVYDD